MCTVSVCTCICTHCTYMYMCTHATFSPNMAVTVGPVVSTPQNLPGISAAFVNLLVHTTTGEIPLRLVNGFQYILFQRNSNQNESLYPVRNMDGLGTRLTK